MDRLKRPDPRRKHTVSALTPVCARPSAPLSCKSSNTAPPSRACTAPLRDTKMVFTGDRPCSQVTFMVRLTIAIDLNTVMLSDDDLTTRMTRQDARQLRRAVSLTPSRKDLYESRFARNEVNLRTCDPLHRRKQLLPCRQAGETQGAAAAVRMSERRRRRVGTRESDGSSASDCVGCESKTPQGVEEPLPDRSNAQALQADESTALSPSGA